MQMNWYVVGPVNLELGSKLIQTNLYVAPIEDDMLLGFDLLRAHCIDLQMSDGQLRVGDEVIPMTMGKVGQAPRVANVTIRDKVTVPPNSVMKLSCQVNCEMPSYIVEAGSPSGLLVPRTLHAAGSQPVVCLINTSDKHVHVRQGELIAQAVEVEKIEVPAKVRVVGTRGGTGPKESDQGVPEHLRDLFGRSKTLLGSLGVVLGKYSVEQICDAQSKDPEFKWLTEWLDDNSCQLAQGDLFRSSQPAKFYWTIKERFSRDERGMIMYHAKDGEGNRLLVPREWRKDIMELCHDIPSAGHQGMTRTQERVKQFYYWHGLKRDLEGYVASCTACNQSKKPNKTARCPMTMFHAGAPMERVHLDFVGPLPKSDRANEHLLMIVDQFSKWVECIPSPLRRLKSRQGRLLTIFSVGLGIHMKYLQTRAVISRVYSSNQFVNCSTSTRLGPPHIALLLMAR
ncbi:Hypothetical predicted protein [Mytilus galloprovincialis]|uniref:Integrase zinc-binding domain-containing protein n=1 Tax=Mytilus galloprovincialis TaxID=29158 RepID=A0A8B6DN79_MYTGA|nr:Hypothetical predicted protein [Mytilus galloprovincialis]